MKQTIRWGIWGTGVIAHKVASDFRVAEGNTLHAIGSRSLDRAKRFASEYGAAKWYAGLNNLLDDSEIDVVYVATPNHRHLDDCMACIEANKAVLCEKPFALNLSQAQRIADAARNRNVFCMEGMWTRFIPAVVEAKRCVDAGQLGPVLLIQGNLAIPAPAAHGVRPGDIEMDGGVLLDLGVYLISLAQYLMGAPQTVRGIASDFSSQVDKQSSYQLRYAGGALADFSASWLVRGSNEVLIAGETGSLRLCEPFFFADKFLLNRYARPKALPTGNLTEQPGRLSKAVRTIRKMPTAKSLGRRLSPLLRVARGERSRRFPFAGNGYQFELMEVGDCLRERKMESAVMPLSDSLSVMRIMDELRAQFVLPGANSV